MQMYWFNELVRAFGMSTSLILEMPQIAKESLYIINDGDIYVFCNDINGQSIPLFRADRVTELPGLFFKVNMGMFMGDYYTFDPKELFNVPKETSITIEA